ncbi:MAG: HAD family hydrolase [Parachlamydiales bacterium]
MSPTPLKALFLDFDGTIADSLNLLYRVYCEFLNHYGKKGSPEEFAELNGPAMSEVLQILKERHGINGNASELFGDYQKKLLQIYAEQVEPYEGTIPFLDEIADRKIACYIVTSASAPLVEAFLTRHALTPKIQEVITPHGLSRSKPDPGIYLRALARSGAKPTDVIAVEDSHNGILAATRAGIPTVAIGHESRPDIATSGVICHAACWEEVLPLCH